MFWAIGMAVLYTVKRVASSALSWLLILPIKEQQRSRKLRQGECLATFYLSTMQNPCLFTVWVICTDPNGTLCVLFVRKSGVFRCSLCLKGQYTFTWAKWCDCRWLWRYGAMSSSTASATRYICHVLGIYLVYANKNAIYQVYAWFILMEKSIYQVYTWYIPCINLSYDDLKYIPDIQCHTPAQNFLGNFGTCHVTVWTWYIPSIKLVYTGYMICPRVCYIRSWVCYIRSKYVIY
jgi:hypothetical protein